MRYVRWAIGVSSIAVCALWQRRNFDRTVRMWLPNQFVILAKRNANGENSERGRRDFHVKVDPKNGGPEHMAVVTEILRRRIEFPSIVIPTRMN